jgi:Ni/Fe-hydrogenase subunit HybB-like protein
LGQYIPGASSYAGSYFATWVEYAETGTMIALGAFIFTIGAKVIPFKGRSVPSKEKCRCEDEKME